MNSGHNETYEYEAPNKDKLQAITGPGKEILAAMGTEGRLCGYTDHYEAARQFSWNPDGTLGTVTYQRWSPPLAIQVDYDYDENGSRWRRRKGSESDLYFDAIAEMKDQELTEYVRIPYATIELRSAGHRVSFSDGLNTAVVVNDQGNMEHLSDYRPYGNKTVLFGAPPETTFNFNEKRREPDIETLYYGARDYDPILRQFLSVDPLRLLGVGDAADGRNLIQPYIYAGSDPVTFKDFQGLEPFVYYDSVAQMNFIVWDTRDTREEAVIAGMDQARLQTAKSDEKGISQEWGGWIFRLPNGQYGYTLVAGKPQPAGAKDQTVNPGYEPSNTVAAFHSHCRHSPMSESISTKDMEVADRDNRPMYMVDQGGGYHLYEPNEGKPGAGQHSYLMPVPNVNPMSYWRMRHKNPNDPWKPGEPAPVSTIWPPTYPIIPAADYGIAYGGFGGSVLRQY